MKKINDLLNELYKMKDASLKLLFNTNYDLLNQEEKALLKEMMTSLEEIKYENNPLPISRLHIAECTNLEEELYFALENIALLITNKVRLNDIKITGISLGDIEKVKDMFSMYEIPLNTMNYRSIANFPITDKILDNYFNGFELAKDINIKVKENKKVLETIINVINSIYVDDENLLKKILKEKLKATYLKETRYKEAIEIISFNDIEKHKNSHLFILNFNEGKIPHTYKDEDFFSDKQKKEKGFITSTEKNQNEINNVREVLEHHENLYLSFSLNINGAQAFVSNIIKNLNIEVEKKKTSFSKYSNKYNKLLLTRYLDRKLKYQEENEFLDILQNTYKVDYLNYDNKFKGIEKEKFLLKLNNTLKLSYSSLNIYQECKFKYYIERVLKINKYEATFSLYIGSLFHYVLSNCYETDFDFNKSWNFFIENSDYQLDDQEKFLLIRLREELKFIIEVIKEKEEFITYDKQMFEKKFDISLGKFSDIELNFEGIIDKIYYKELTNQTNIVIIDYKTGMMDIKIDLIQYGLSLQLPVYVYLVKEANYFKNAVVNGIFIQNILHKDKIIKDNDVTKAQEEKKKLLLLDGYLLYDSDFDKTIANSQLIKGLKKKIDGSFYGYSKVLSPEEITNMYTVAKDVISSAFKDIISCDFSINPKLIFSEDYSCKYCKYSDLCYKTYKDYIKISIDKKEGE